MKKKICLVVLCTVLIALVIVFWTQQITDDGQEIYEDIEGCARVYEYWSDFKDDYDLPYADEEVIAILREAYGEITFQILLL